MAARVIGGLDDDSLELESSDFLLHEPLDSGVLDLWPWESELDDECPDPKDDALSVNPSSNPWRYTYGSFAERNLFLNQFFV